MGQKAQEIKTLAYGEKTICCDNINTGTYSNFQKGDDVMIIIEPWLSNLFHVILTVGFLLYSYRLILND